MSQYIEPSNTVPTRSFEGAFLAVATQYETTGSFTDALKVVVEDRIKEIQLGFEAFKKPSATSRTGMTAATRADGKKFTDAQVILAKRLSDIVKLDEMQALKIIDDFSLELDVPDAITEDVVLKAVISYWKERSSLVSLLGELVRQSVLNESRLEYEKIAAVEGVRSQSVALIRKLLAQYHEKVLEDAPEYFTANAGYLDLWIGQSLAEQSALLETMIALAYGGTDSKTELPGAVISTLISTQFGKQQAYKTRFKVEAVDNWEGIRLLCVTLSLASLDLESLFTTSAAESYESSDHVFKSAAQVQNVNKALQSAERQQELGPFILAWSSVLWANMASQSGDQTESRRFAAQLAYVSIETLDVFKYLHGIFNNELFQSYSKDGSTYKRIFFLLLEVTLLNHDSKAIKDFDGLVACLADLLTDEPDLCQNVWEESPALGQGTVQVLDTARGRFPLQFEPLAKLLSALATGGKESAEHTVYYFSHLPSLTHLIQITPASIEVNAHPTTGATILKALQDVPFGIIPERPLLVLPAGTIGSLISGPNAAQIVQWRHENSGWDLCLIMLEAFQQVNVEDFEPESRVDIAQIKAILDLSEAVYRFPVVAHGLLDTLAKGEGKGSPIPTFFAILDQCSKFQQPPLDVIASCLKCITRLADAYTQDIWLYLRQSSFLPSVITTTVQFTGLSRVQTSGLAYNILSRFECLRGNYAVTLAFLDLVQKLIIDAQQMEIWDQHEMRCTKSEVLYPCLVYFQNDIFINYESWQYSNIRDRFSIASKILSIFNTTLDDLPLLGGSDPSDYISLDTLQEYLFKNFLYDGGKQLTLPLVSIIGSGPDFSAYFSKYNRLREMEEIWVMVSEGLKLVKTLLRHRKMSGGQPSFLEVYMIDRTVGRANASLIRVLASYCDFSCGEAAALESTDVLTLLCSLTSEWKTRPSFVGYLGTTEQAQQLVSTLVSRVIDDSQPTSYRIALWSFITITLTTQPGLAILFLSKDHMNPDTKVPDNHFKESAKNSVLFKALEILHKGDVVLKSDPEILPHALHFLDILWQNAKDHAVVIKGLQENEVFWQDLAQILSRPMAHTDLECGRWEDAATQYNRDALAQVWNVTHANADQRSRGDALRIFALAIHYHCAEKGISSRNLDSLPKGVKEFVKECASKGRFLEWNETFPVIHYHIEGHRELKRMRRFMSSNFDYQKLAVRRWDDFYDTDYLPGDSFMLDLERARCKLIWGGREHEHAFLRTVFHVNLNTSMVHSEMHLLSAWRFFMDIVATDLESSVWATKAGKTAGPEWYYEFVNCLLGHIERDTMGSLILGMARQHCSQLLLSVIESTTAIRRSDKKNMAVYFPEIVTRLQRLIQSPDVDVLTAIQNPVEGQSAHQPLLLAILFCYRALHEKEVLSSLDLERLEELQKSAILIQPTIANCFSTIAQSHLLGQRDHSDNIVILLALLEELCHPVWNPHPSLWIPVLRNADVFRFNLQLCARSVSSGDYDSRPSFFEGSLNFLLALANIPEMAVYLYDAGVMSMLTHNGLTPLIQRGEISHLDRVHGDRGNWHQAWCMMLATVTSLLRTMCTSEAFLQLLIGFITLYSNQIKVGLETSTDGPLTSAKLEELERISMLFYELSKNDARLEALGGGWLLPAFFEHSRHNLQHAVYFFTHPHTLASAILPITAEENKAKESGQGSALSMMIEGKLAAVVRNILSTILAWTDPAVILTKSNLEWPIRKRVIEPTTETQAYKPASFGTMFDLVQYASTSLKEWEARLEGKTGGSAGLYKDASDDDRQNNINTTSSTSTASSATSSRLAYFGSLLTTTAPSSAASTNTAAGSLLTTRPSSSITPSQPASSLTSSAAASLAVASMKANESAFATLSTTTGSSTRMISLLEDALVVIATQLGLYMYYPEQDATSRRDIQDQCLDLISTLNSTQRMLQRFENVPVQARKDSLGEEAHAMIRSLRDIMIPIIKNFAETKIIVL